MKKAGFISLSFLVLLLFSSKANAQNITTGNQSAETHVTNTVNGGSVNSHVETTVNGQTTTVDSNQPGELDIKNVNGTVTISKTPNAKVTITENKNATKTPTIIPKPIHKNFLSGFFDNIKNFFKRIFHNL